MTTYPVPEGFRAKSHLDEQRYREMYRQSVEDPAAFWSAQAERFLDWAAPWDEVLSHDCRYISQ